MQRTELIEAEIEGQPEHVRSSYQRMISEGLTPVMAHMLAMRQAPRQLGGDQFFCEGNYRAMREMTDENRDNLVAEATKAGINVNGKAHISGIGSASDPGAWVTSSDDVLAVCKERGLSVTGAVNYKAPEREYVPETKKKTGKNKV